MKKLHLILAFAFTMMVGSAFAQNVAVGGATGVNILARSGVNVTIPIVPTVEWAFKDNMSVAGDIGYEVGVGKNSSGMFYFSPEFRYFMNQAFDGFYVGGFIGAGAASRGFGNYVSLGAALGYQIMVKENFNIDVHGQAGYGSFGSRFGTGRAHGFHLRPTVGLRYVFNNK